MFELNFLKRRHLNDSSDISTPKIQVHWEKTFKNAANFKGFRRIYLTTYPLEKEAPGILKIRRKDPNFELKYADITIRYVSSENWDGISVMVGNDRIGTHYFYPHEHDLTADSIVLQKFDAVHVAIERQDKKHYKAYLIVHILNF